MGKAERECFPFNLSHAEGQKMMKSQPINQKQRSGFTLVELLVTIAVIVTVAAVLVPSVKFLLSDRKIREAARISDGFIVKTQSDAINRGMGGIWIERDEFNPYISYRIYQAKSPAPYTGDFLGARSRITAAQRNTAETINGVDDDSNGIVDDLFIVQVDFSLSECPSAPRLIEAGDYIQFDFKGPYFRIMQSPSLTGGAAGYTSEIIAVSTVGPAPRVPTGAFALTPFRVIRQPERSTAGYLDMPKGTMIDLSKSGLTVLDLNGNGLADDPLAQGTELGDAAGLNMPVIVTFDSNGQMDTIFIGGQPLVPDRSLHLLLANDNTEDLADLDMSNSTASLEDLSNFWLTITRQGAVSTTQVSDLTPVTNPTSPGELLRVSRREARLIETTGGG